MITVDEVMVTTLHTLPETATVHDARELMEKKQIRHVPIVDGERLVGLVSQRDLLRASRSSLLTQTLEDIQALEKNHRVSEIMTREVCTVDERDSLKSAALMMRKHRFDCVPVVTEGKLRGIVTDTDFVGIAIHLIEQMEQMESSTEWDEPAGEFDDFGAGTGDSVEMEEPY